MAIEIDCEIDLVSDYAKILADKLESMGFPAKPGVAPDDICIRYHNIMRRLIVAQPRRIHRASEFQCPQEYILGLERLEEEVCTGRDLLSRLSRYIADLEKAKLYPDFDDNLLNDWGIHHLHLGEKTNDKGVIEGTESVLLALFLPYDAYFIGLFRHGEWGNEEIIQRVHRNWPELLAPFRMKDIVAIERPVTDEDRKLLRKAHINSVVEVEPGVVYLPPGRGMTASGTSVEVVENWHGEKRLLSRTEEKIRADLVTIAEMANQKLGVALTRFRFQLILTDGKWSVLELNSNIFLETGLIVACREA